MDWKKLLWRAVRGALYTFAASWVSKHTGGFLSPEVALPTLGALLMAGDKAAGIGGLVAPAAKP